MPARWHTGDVCFGVIEKHLVGGERKKTSSGGLRFRDCLLATRVLDVVVLKRSLDQNPQEAYVADTVETVWNSPLYGQPHTYIILSPTNGNAWQFVILLCCQHMSHPEPGVLDFEWSSWLVLIQKQVSA